MFVELHVLQNFAPSCLNRDDTNTPKDCEFGGYRRARISSQCLKRAARDYFHDHGLFPKTDCASRTKYVVDEVIRRLPDHLRNDDRAAAAVVAVLPTQFKVTIKKQLSDFLLFLADDEFTGLASIVEHHFDVLADAGSMDATDDPKPQTNRGKKSKAKKITASFAEEVTSLLESGEAYDLALFGRMLTGLPEKQSRRAACQVAHALSTHAVKIETDYFTAVDDLKPEDSYGAGHVDTLDFNSSCFYRYSSVSLNLLRSNLGGITEKAQTALRGYLLAAIHAIPTGRQNGSAAFNPPSAVLAVVRKHGQWSLANAFVQPVRPSAKKSIVDQSIEQMDRYWGRLSETYGDDDVHAAFVALEDSVDTTALSKSKVKTVNELVDIAVSKAGGLLG